MDHSASLLLWWLRRKWKRRFRRRMRLPVADPASLLLWWLRKRIRRQWLLLKPIDAKKRGGVTHPASFTTGQSNVTISCAGFFAGSISSR